MAIHNKAKVLIVDDSAIVRKILSEAISAEPDLEVVGTAPDPFVARGRILELKPDVLTLDIEMPRMDGVSFLKRLMRYHPLPVIVISSLAQSSCTASLDALRAGAIDVLAKPSGPYSVGELKIKIAEKVRAASVARIRPASDLALAHVSTDVTPPIQNFRPNAILALGASTGGTEALVQVLKALPATCPPLAIVQHIAPVFSSAFASRLNQICAISVKEAQDGDALQKGEAVIAPGDRHMLLHHRRGRYEIEVKDGPAVCYQRPSVDVLFTSVAAAAGRNAVGALLTGMGIDGAQGLLAMKRAGARTVVQDEATSVVFGMPKEAIRLGAADEIAPLSKVAAALLQAAC